MLRSAGIAEIQSTVTAEDRRSGAASSRMLWTYPGAARQRKDEHPRQQQQSDQTAHSACEMQRIAKRLQRYIAGHCCRALDMTELAEREHLSRSHMFKIFKKYNGCTPYHYLMEQRIGLAKRLLRRSEESVAQIGMRIGFNDPSHFNRSFKEATGMTPGAYQSAVQCGAAGESGSPRRRHRHA
ncbi:helix-turn-helix transcriptional regulator [Paenibacillus sp. IB182496]|uniref:Helix-turn-helix transcriptional regulator n=1 Tax=Paenibacillus sabuli TaxID=2772509 RepID=A0A927GT76_9BACL|nr:helix-turn-helix transcriptional regulator [Paenibacillus sabuli]MBD2847051.1 helix-turn-helix transcriptional regulator [Paenibacillus sabuli]